MQIQELATEVGFSPNAVARELRTTKAEIAHTLGLSRDALSRASRIGAPKTQTRLRQMLEILNRVEGLVGSALVAYAWFRSEPLPGFADMTPSQLVRDGKADGVHAYLDQVLDGGYA
ncbi:MAG: DUF2384 domain-containing protein [Gammaproteobacteria bacterium]|nr:DUF2384 domain-containing protein [Gammaproteobacteria bacterium]MCY4344184.1 DUF2384 domain-containing protein [Gammaproteobacteria bacterium]